MAPALVLVALAARCSFPVCLPKGGVNSSSSLPPAILGASAVLAPARWPPGRARVRVPRGALSDAQIPIDALPVWPGGPRQNPKPQLVVPSRHAGSTSRTIRTSGSVGSVVLVAFAVLAVLLWYLVALVAPQIHLDHLSQA